MTASTHVEPARVVSLPVRQADAQGPVAVSDVLAEVLPLAAFRRPARREVQSPELARRCAALTAIGAWRRAHPSASLEDDLVAAERISGEFGV